MFITLLFIACAGFCVAGLIKPSLIHQIDKENNIKTKKDWVGIWVVLFIFCALLSTCVGDNEKKPSEAEQEYVDKRVAPSPEEQVFLKDAEKKGYKKLNGEQAVITEMLKSMQSHQFDFTDGILKVVFTNEDRLYYEFYSSVVISFCYMLFDKKKDGLDNLNIKEIQVLNRIAAQGYALPNPRSYCKTIGTMNSDEEKRYLPKVSHVCVAGVCRTRQVGKVASGDPEKWE